MAIIYTYPTKTNPTANDLVLISDASDGNKTKNAKISSLQSTVAGVASLNTLAGNVLLSSDDSNILVASNPSSNTVSLGLAKQIDLGSGTLQDTAVSMDDNAGIFSKENVPSTTSYTVTVVQNSEGKNVYALNGVEQPVIELVFGETYTFDWSSAGGSHPFEFVKTTNEDPNQPSTIPYTDGVVVNGTTTTITVGSGAASRIFYRCTQHEGMGNIASFVGSVDLSVAVDGLDVASIDGRNNAIKGITNFSQGIQLGSTSEDILSDYETGFFYPWVEVNIYDQQNAENVWSSWGGSEDVQWYNTQYQSYGYYTKVGNAVTITFRVYPLNQSSERFVCNGIRIKLPYNFRQGSLAKGFTGSLSEGKQNTQGINAGWVSGSYLYMLQSQVGLTESTTTPETYENLSNVGLTDTWTDGDQITVSGIPGQANCTTDAVDDKYRYPSVYWSSFGRTTRYSLRANNYSLFSFGGSGQVTVYTS